jgi:hypothetical protein
MAKTATLMTFGRVKAVKDLTKYQQYLTGVAAAGEAATGLKALSDGEKLKALGKFVGAGFFGFELSHSLRTLASLGKQRVRSYRLLSEKTKDEIAECPLIQKLVATVVGLICIDRL